MIKTFAAIDAGSYELAMKIFEISRKNGIREIDHIRHRIDLGSESYATGKISCEHIDELCHKLIDFKEIMKGYQVDDYCAYGTSAFRETRNKMILLDQIRNRTGLSIDVLSNSEQRFLDYKAIALKGESFETIIKKGTAILDIGGGSIQISLFDEERLVTTQNLRLGVLRLNELLKHITTRTGQEETILHEMIKNQMTVFQKIHLKERKTDHVIIIDDYVADVIRRQYEGQIGLEEYGKLVVSLKNKNKREIAGMLSIPEENALLLYLSAILVREIMEITGAKTLYAPGGTLCDGIAYEYAEKNKLLRFEHDFEEDIIACAKNISKRYMGSRNQAEALEQIALCLFDGTKKIHGLTKRERLYLQIAAILHDCGRYINMTGMGECSYHIIMNTEIIGLSHTEREIVANLVKYHDSDFAYYEEMGRISQLDRASYLKIAKLTAILRVAKGLEEGQNIKPEEIRLAFRENELVISVMTQEDLTLEKGLFGDNGSLFEEVYNMKPVISQRKLI